MRGQVQQVHVIPGRPYAVENAGERLFVVPADPKTITIGGCPGRLCMQTLLNEIIFGFDNQITH